MSSELPKIQEPLTFTEVKSSKNEIEPKNRNQSVNGQIFTTELGEIKNDVKNAIDLQESIHTMGLKSEVLKVWEEQQKQERELRKEYSTQLMNIFWLQLIVMYILLFPVAFGFISLTDEQFSILFVSVLAEITALVTIVTKYLFSKDDALNISDLWAKGEEKKKEDEIKKPTSPT